MLQKISNLNCKGFMHALTNKFVPIQNVNSMLSMLCGCILANMSHMELIPHVESHKIEREVTRASTSADK